MVFVNKREKIFNVGRITHISPLSSTKTKRKRIADYDNQYLYENLILKLTVRLR